METSRKIRIKPLMKMSTKKQSDVFNQKRLSIIEENNIEKTFNTKTEKNSDEEIELSPEKKKKQKRSDFISSFTRLNLINLFVKHLKLVSGKYGPLGAKQLKIINDVSTEESYCNIKHEEKSDIDTHNIFVKLIVNATKIFFLIFFFLEKGTVFAK